MPQLTPTPWLAYLLFSWLIFSVIVLPKVSTHTFMESPAPLTKQKPDTEPWNWPWH
ncbi:ATP synthase F0 subunit 8 (mitochondrion) [Gambusia affinis]|uniref:ATP synthase complex subunit 8 n=1 Tax=Gambusia affinis TaxID=33528 RepID=Q8HLV9_GAMAF|nr:ATP synthase F0 subunit 8 [Gambusia affinis]UXB58280.1 ATP synthase F0 subunit 8 [Gambusia affinis]UXB58293.1 ATP synthase F0 subunit 8 [Gambusia affinis]BAC23389.1 ATPase subunit 8 [Gambusia affinis]